jgi:ATP-dependent RNA circularization protein (DNA/RNA ligase family)
MSGFFRFPHTPHLAWLGKGAPRDDKVLSSEEAHALLSGEVVVEEKLDGANLGFSVSPDRVVRIQNRGQYLSAPFTGQFEKLEKWFSFHTDGLFDALGEDLILFGEWCAARHSLNYDNLPDWFLAFDVYDRKFRRFWSTARRNELAIRLGISFVPKLFHGLITLGKLNQILQSELSAYRSGPLEGVVIRRESADWLETCAKLVRPEFTQAISEHWRNRAIEWNRQNMGRDKKGSGFEKGKLR